MRKNFRKQLYTLAECAYHMDEESMASKLNCLQKIIKTPLPKSSILIQYFETLLFLQAYPSNPSELALVYKEMQRLTSFLKKNQKEFSVWLQNTGLPYCVIVTQFSHDAVRWLLTHPDCKTEIDSFGDVKTNLCEMLNITLPSTEKHIAETGMVPEELMDTLLVSKKDRLTFIVNEFSRLEQQPQVKDTLFDQVELYVSVSTMGPGVNKASNQLPVHELFYHDELNKRFDHELILNTSLPTPQALNKAQRDHAIQVVKNTMMLTARETDPTTYMQSESFRIYMLERGISIAIYGMEASRQLPLESYVGYTVFKNGLPVSYGGSWIFRERANFGINIFEPFRKGESGYIMAQLLRVYKNVFGITYFEVEPYQYGLNNPEEIESGAFWFYYKHGFRPVDRSLNALAAKEAKQIKNKKGYRTSHKTLVQFTESNLCLKLGRKVPASVPSITTKITRMIQCSFKGNRILAESTCIAEFKNKTGLKRVTASEIHALSEMALWAKAMNVADKTRLTMMTKLVATKSKDLYVYQQVLLKFLA